MRPAVLTLVLGLVLSAGSDAAAQADSAARPRSARVGPAVGALVGYSRSDLALAGGGGSLVQSRQGALTGLSLQFPLADAFAIRPEVLFSLKGGRTVATLEGQGEADIDIELAYLELPVLARVSIPTGRLRPVLFGGPALALQIGCDFRFTLPADSVRATCGEDNLATVREWDFGLVGGGGIELRLRRATLALEARYTAGMRSVLEGIELENRSFGVGLNLTF